MRPSIASAFLPVDCWIPIFLAISTTFSARDAGCTVPGDVDSYGSRRLRLPRLIPIRKHLICNCLWENCTIIHRVGVAWVCR